MNYKLFFAIFSWTIFVVTSNPSSQQLPVSSGLARTVSMFGNRVNSGSGNDLDQDHHARADVQGGVQMEMATVLTMPSRQQPLTFLPSAEAGTGFDIHPVILEILRLQQASDDRQAALMRANDELRVLVGSLSAHAVSQQQQIVRLQDQRLQDLQNRLAELDLFRRVERQYGVLAESQTAIALHIQTLSDRVQKLEQPTRAGKK